jgi:replication factor C subunit 1
MSYVPTLSVLLSRPMVQKGKDGIDEVIGVLDGYMLDRDDWEGVLELGVGRGDKERVLMGLDSKVKSSFTSTYNKGSHPVAFRSVKNFKAVKSKGGEGLDGFEEDGDGGEESGEEEDEGVGGDRMIKEKKKGKEVKGKGKAKEVKSKGKGRAK